MEGSSSASAKKTAATPTTEQLALVILSYPTDPSRIGEVAFLPDGQRLLLGREPSTDTNLHDIAFGRQRPGSFTPSELRLAARTLSRKQTIFRAERDVVRVENIGRTSIVIDSGKPNLLGIGCTMAIGKTMLLACTRRPLEIPNTRHFPIDHSPPVIGIADKLGFAGESALAWELRERIAEAAVGGGGGEGGQQRHVLLRGVAGSGRGLAARMVHALSPQKSTNPVVVNASAMGGAAAAKYTEEMFFAPKSGLIERAIGTSLIIERADALSVELQTRIADEVDARRQLSHRSPGHVRLILTIDARTDTAASSPLFKRSVDCVEVPSFGARIEDVWCFLLAAGADRDGLDVEVMASLVVSMRRAGWPAIANLLPPKTTRVGAGAAEVRPSAATSQKPRDPAEFAAFTEAVRDALTSYHDATKLQSNALLTMLRTLRETKPSRAVEDLRDILRRAIDRIDGDTERELLKQSYVTADPNQVSVAERLHIPQVMYLRYLERATEMLADRLWQQNRS